MSHNSALHSTYLAQRMGSAVVSPSTLCKAGPKGAKPMS